MSLKTYKYTTIWWIHVLPKLYSHLKNPCTNTLKKSLSSYFLTHVEQHRVKRHYLHTYIYIYLYVYMYIYIYLYIRGKLALFLPPITRHFLAKTTTIVSIPTSNWTKIHAPYVWSISLKNVDIPPAFLNDNQPTQGKYMLKLMTSDIQHNFDGNNDDREYEI